MKTKDFSFNLPEHLIAQYPQDKRDNSKLFAISINQSTEQTVFTHHSMSDFVDLLLPETLIVLNNSKVRKARIYGLSKHGGRVEFLLLKPKKFYESLKLEINNDEIDNHCWMVMLSKSKKQNIGKEYTFPEEVKGEIINKNGSEAIVRFSKPIDDTYLDQYGHIPLPPYIKRDDTAEDVSRYQTVYAKHYGSVAAPTAGLHFTDRLLHQIRENGIKIVEITHHVGLGTFLPVRSEDIENHEMHSETFSIPEECAAVITGAKKKKKPVLAVGTTVARALESAWNNNNIQPGTGSTDLFIYPGYIFKVVDSLLTNFHTPQSTLIMLVAALVGIETIKKAYQVAVDKEYRFFSYGDAMLIQKANTTV